MNDLMSKSFRRVRHGEDLYEDVDLETGKSEPVGVQMKNLRKNSKMNLKTSEESMADFFREIEVVKGETSKVKQVLLKLKNANEESKRVTRADALKELRERMDNDVALVLKSARVIKAKLVELDDSNLAHRQVPGCGAGSASDRQRVLLTENQRKKLKDLMDEFQALRGKIVDEYKETIGRRYYNLTGKQAEEETIESMIRTGESETFLQQAIREQGRGPVLETIREIQERHDGVKEIEKHLLELHTIFMDMSVLVDAQGHMINDIEAQVNRAASYTRAGTTHLVQARKHQWSARKWTAIAILLLIIILVVVILIVLKFTKTM